MADDARMEEQDLAAVRSRYVAVVERWSLDDAGAARLLGVAGDWRIGALSIDAEARLRLVVEIDALLGMVLRDDDAAAWIRRPNEAFVDHLTPLDAMSQGRHVIRGVRNVLEDIGAAR